MTLPGGASNTPRTVKRPTPIGACSRSSASLQRVSTASSPKGGAETRIGDEIRDIEALVRAAGYGADRIAFDPSVHEYSTSCEESQGFSPTFNAFARDLARRWVQQYGLAGRSVLEIGCGWGSFALTAAREYGARVTAATISPVASARMRARSTQ